MTCLWNRRNGACTSRDKFCRDSIPSQSDNEFPSELELGLSPEVSDNAISASPLFFFAFPFLDYKYRYKGWKVIPNHYATNSRLPSVFVSINRFNGKFPWPTMIFSTATKFPNLLANQPRKRQARSALTKGSHTVGPEQVVLLVDIQVKKILWEGNMKKEIPHHKQHGRVYLIIACTTGTLRALNGIHQ